MIKLMPESTGRHITRSLDKSARPQHVARSLGKPLGGAGLRCRGDGKTSWTSWTEGEGEREGERVAEREGEGGKEGEEGRQGGRERERGKERGREANLLDWHWAMERQGGRTSRRCLTTQFLLVHTSPEGTTPACCLSP